MKKLLIAVGVVLAGLGLGMYLSLSGLSFAAISTLSSSDTQNTERAIVNQLVNYANNFGTTTTNTWTGHQIFSSLFATRASSTHATSTNQDITGLLTFNGITGNSWDDFCATITGGAGLCDGTDADTTYTAGDALSLTGTDFDFDGGATPSGDLGGTWASPSVTDDSHAHTSTTISGLDISADTDLAVTYPIILTDDTLSTAFGTTTHQIFSSVYLTSASTTNATTTGSLYITPLATAAGTFLAVDPAGRVIATTTPSGATGANPTGTIGLTAVNGSALTFLRSDGAPALSQAIVPTWTGLHLHQSGNGNIVAAAGAAAAAIQVQEAGGGQGGVINFGNNTASIGVSSDGVLNGYDYDGAFVFRQLGTNPDSDGEFIFQEEGGEWRFVLPTSGVGKGTYNPRSMIIAGPATSTSGNLRCASWGFLLIDCDTSGTGADLGVQDDLQVLGTVYSTLASTTLLSVHRTAYFGGTATTTIDSAGTITGTSGFAHTFPYASSTALSVSGTAFLSQITNSTVVQLNVGTSYVFLDSTSFTPSPTITLGKVAEPWAKAFLTYASSTAVSVSGTGYFGTASSTNLTVSSLTSAVLLAGSSGTIGEASTQTCTNQFVRALSAAYSATCATIVSEDIDLTDAFAWTGAHDFGGATSLEIPNGTGPTVDAIGEIALDTTANQLLIATSTNASFPAVFSNEDSKGGIFGTSTLRSMGAFGAAGTTTLAAFHPKRAGKITDYYCAATTAGNGTSTVRIGNGTASSSYALAGNFSAANLSGLAIPVAARGAIYVEFGTELGTPAYWDCNWTYIQDRL